GGYLWEKTTLFLGTEVEIAHPATGKEAHFLAFFPTYKTIRDYARRIRPAVTNPFLSTQRLRTSPDSWLKIVAAMGGVALAAHAFTPHKGVYGNCVSRLGQMFADPEKIKGLELGLSADTKMAWGIKDTHGYPYLSNSDAHSLETIAREFTVYNLPRLNFEEWRRVLKPSGLGIKATCGLEPLLGKYYRSFCSRCQWLAREDQPVLKCPHCQRDMIIGVWDRVQAISDWEGNSSRRPPYIAHVPLMMLPGIGPKTYGKMIANLGTEIDILYSLPLDLIERACGEKISAQIEAIREGRLPIIAGGGGKYGRVSKTLER
ncbi:MAG: TIGR00375 family protein, partial [Firmicutes bacterium]|nr:TIGR00375 family protein [Bacillota bacterium]